MTKRYSIFWVIALSIGIFGCSDTGTSDNDLSDSGETRELRIFSWGDYFDPETLEEFTEQTGIKVRIIEFDNAEEMVASLHSQPDQYDVITIDDHTLSQIKELSLLKGLEAGRLNNLKNIDQKIRAQISEGGDNIHAIPYMSGTTLVAYRKDKIPDIRKSWSVLFDARYKGRMAMLDEFDDNLAIALVASGYSMNSTAVSDIKAAKNLLLDQIRELGGRIGTYADILEALDSGDIWVAVNYSGESATAAEENSNIDYFLPEEGPILWIDSLVVSRDSLNVDEAYAFLDFIMRGEIAARNATYLSLATPNVAAVPHMDPDVMSDDRIYLSQEMLSKAEPIRSVHDESHIAMISKANREFLNAVRNANAFLSQVGSEVAQSQYPEEVEEE